MNEMYVFLLGMLALEKFKSFSRAGRICTSRGRLLVPTLHLFTVKVYDFGEAHLGRLSNVSRIRS